MELKAVDLTKKFGPKIALDHVNFKLSGPGIVGYLGPNGAGKTTTLKIFSHLLRPSSGSALVNGIDMTKDYQAGLRHVSSLVETPEPYPEFSIKEFLTFIGSIREINPADLEKRISILKKQLSLESLDTKCGTLSKGNKQRVVLAAVLLPDTPILLLDEPTSGLDPAETHDIKRVLKDLGRRKLILMSSHILQEVKELCRMAAVVNNGKLLILDSVRNITLHFGKRKAGVPGLEEAYLKLVRGV